MIWWQQLIMLIVAGVILEDIVGKITRMFTIKYLAGTTEEEKQQEEKESDQSEEVP